MARALGVVTMALCALAALACGSSDESGTGGSGAATGTGGQTAAGGSGGGDAAPSCDAYCASVMKSCTGDNAVYVSNDACMGVCATFDIGAAADTTGNTVGCRTYHAGAAAMAPTEHCPHAGPGGAGFCGNNCEGYCSIMMSACPGEFADEAACLDACGQYTDSEPFNANVKTGDTLQCRLYHASVATLDSVHCAHANAVSTAEFCGATTN